MMRISTLLIGLALLAAFSVAAISAHAQTDAEKKEQYVNAVVRGEGYLPWQERGLSGKEIDFRKQMEERKTKLLAERGPIKHPVMIDAEARGRARKNLAKTEWAGQVVAASRKIADFIASQPDEYVEQMIGELTPWYDYGMTCPNCVGVKSQEGTGHGLMLWDHLTPDQLTCKQCGQVYPSDKYPETLKLVCPRTGQTFSFYMNPREQANPDDRTGTLAYKWGGHGFHMSFSGLINRNKTSFMISSVSDLSMMYIITEDPRYARRAQQILLRLAKCYRGWLYHDYWNSVIDADPLYTAWHSEQIPLVWKKHLTTNAYARDTMDKVRIQTFWGAGRLHPSTDNMGSLVGLASAFDMVADAKDENGKPLWSDADKGKVERDLFLEWIFTSEPYIGGPDQATLNNNKSPRLYHAYAAVARALNLPRLADTAMKGYEAVRDKSFNYDGFSVESPGYTMMYLEQLPAIPELLHDFDWPDSFPTRKAAGDIYASDPKLRMIYRAMIDQLRPDGLTLPIEDTQAGVRVPDHCIHVGLKRYPEYFTGKAKALAGGERAGLYALFNLDDRMLSGDGDLNLEDIYFPSWMTGILRHGSDKNSAVLALNFSPVGGHRHRDSLTLYYIDHGQTMAGDLGYCGDTPLNNWIRSTFSHNLVIVDDKTQSGPRFGEKRTPKLELMASTPNASAVEASSEVYAQCSEYRRLVILLKGPDQQTCAVDIFRVTGGAKHDFRLFSELASSDAGAAGALKFEGVTMQAEAPLPNFEASLKTEHIFGLRDVREGANPASELQVTWSEPGRSYRFWCLGQVGKVAASNGPGQETHARPGRRVRVLDLINEVTTGTSSTFVGVHEPSLTDGTMPVKSAKRLHVPPEAGPAAVAIRIETAWGSYLVLNEFANEAQVEGVRFQGKLGIYGEGAGGKPWLMASGASTLQNGKFGFSGKPAQWRGEATPKTPDKLTVSDRPKGWSDPPRGCQAYVLMNDGQFETGFPVQATTGKSIKIDRFPVPAAAKNGFCLPALRYVD